MKFSAVFIWTLIVLYTMSLVINYHKEDYMSCVVAFIVVMILIWCLPTKDKPS